MSTNPVVPNGPAAAGPASKPSTPPPAAAKAKAPQPVAKPSAFVEKLAPKIAKKVAKAAAKAKRSPRLDPSSKVKVLTKENPFAEGTKSHTTYQLLLKSMTVSDFVDAVAKSKKEVFAAAHFLRYVAQPHGKQPAHVEVA